MFDRAGVLRRHAHAAAHAIPCDTDGDVTGKMCAALEQRKRSKQGSAERHLFWGQLLALSHYYHGVLRASVSWCVLCVLTVYSYN